MSKTTWEVPKLTLRDKSIPISQKCMAYNNGVHVHISSSVSIRDRHRNRSKWCLKFLDLVENAHITQMNSKNKFFRIEIDIKNNRCLGRYQGSSPNQSLIISLCPHEQRKNKYSILWQKFIGSYHGSFEIENISSSLLDLNLLADCKYSGIFNVIKTIKENARRNIISKLESAAERYDEEQFSQLTKEIELQSFSPSEIISIIRASMKVGANLLARNLVNDAIRLYPTDDELRKFARILAPPRTIKTNIPAKPGLLENQNWLRINSEKYRGKWVVLKSGNLIADSYDIEELKTIIENKVETMVTKVI